MCWALVFGVYAISGSAVLRVAGIVLLAVWARRSITAWIFVAMLAGVELGVDAPRLAVQCKVFSDIFLRLIRMIVAPLILGTLVTGIAGHGSLRQVGRIGVKALVYFEGGDNPGAADRRGGDQPDEGWRWASDECAAELL